MNRLIHNNLPSAVKQCIYTLEKNGYQAWIVGGAVRDMLMGKTPSDFDVATNALPAETIKIFPKTFTLGEKFGTVTVQLDSSEIEVTTFRNETGYLDSRHPSQVNFVSDIREDLARRDFTVNAIAYSPSCGFFDPFNGMDDLKKKCLRAVGNAEERFHEDALRIFRCFRFAAVLGFEVYNDTLQAALRLAPTLKKISVERIMSEMQKLLCSAHPEMLELLVNAGGLSHLGISCLQNTASLVKTKAEFIFRFCGMLILSDADCSSLQCLKLSNSLLKAIKPMYIRCHLPLSTTKVEIKREYSHVPPEIYRDYLYLRYAVLDENIESVLSVHEEIQINNEAWSIDMLAVDGNDLISAGIPEGKAIGIALDTLLDHVIGEPSLNTKEILLGLECVW